MNDSLTYSNYFQIALWLSGRVDSTAVRLQKRAPTLPKYTTEEKELLLAHLRNEKEVI